MRVQAASQSDGRFQANVALEDFLVVALGLDGAPGPFLVEADHFAQVAFRTQKPLDVRVIAIARPAIGAFRLVLLQVHH